MIKMVNIVKIAKMDDEKRKKEMTGILMDLLKEKSEKTQKELEKLITEMKNVTDDEYLNLCLTNMLIANTLDDENVKNFLALRLKANSEMPDNIKSRDMKMIESAMAKSPENVRARLSSLMPKNQ